MTSLQNSMFQAGAGVTPSTLMVAIASMVISLTFIWVIWVTLGTFRAWQSGEVSVFELTWSVLRACIVLMVLGFYLR
ncbi:TIGR03758 family integrating conjugative element protein [Pseudomaricurvus alkylphenolicus]|nr:TIGR03758 family integrating conjugative element protein [Pseudomaricurvus alkylphenolicus]